ncbi:MAG: TetR/AcrR family transcriptional regulator, partial [Chthoniobacterales bacterium]
THLPMSESESKERILAAAKALFLARGYAATSVDSICEKAGLSKGSFYHFFDSKDALGLAAVDWTLQQSAAVLENGPHAAISDPVQHGLAYLEHVENCSSELWGAGCLLCQFALELGDTNEPMRKVISTKFQTMSDDVAAKLEPLVAACAPGAVVSAPELANQLLCSLEGSIIHAKAHRDPSRVPKAVRAFRTTLAGHLPLPA